MVPTEPRRPVHDPTHYPHPRELVRWYSFLHDLCYRRQASIRSGCRTRLHNLAVGGNSRSRHTFEHGRGLAADLWFDEAAQRELAKLDVRMMGYHWYEDDTYDPRQLHVQADAPAPRTTTT